LPKRIKKGSSPVSYRERHGERAHRRMGSRSSLLASGRRRLEVDDEACGSGVRLCFELVLA
jgi:hypothetical protein